MEVRHDAKSLTYIKEFLFSQSSRVRYSRRREVVQLKFIMVKYTYCCTLMWKASLLIELPELGASSRNAPEAFVTLRPTQSSKWTWRLSYYFKSTRTESNKRDGHGEKRALSDTWNTPGTCHCVMEILAHSQYESMLSSTAIVHRRSS